MLCGNHLNTLLFPLRLSPRLFSSAFNSSVLREETYIAGSGISCSEDKSRCLVLTASELVDTRPSAIVYTGSMKKYSGVLCVWPNPIRMSLGSLQLA